MTRGTARAKAPILKLPQPERQALLDDLNYLNTEEIKSFCTRHSIPFRIVFESPDGCRTAKDHDRKGIVLGRIRHFLETGKVLPATRFPAAVVRVDPPPEILSPDDRLFYGQYDKANCGLTGLLEDLTGGQFRNGAIARILAHEFWSAGRAPTFREFAAAWLRAVNEHTAPNPEWAFLSDRANQTAGSDWKKLRSRKAAAVLQKLGRITPAV